MLVPFLLTPSKASLPSPCHLSLLSSCIDHKRLEVKNCVIFLILFLYKEGEKRKPMKERRGKRKKEGNEWMNR
jgi:hypothetical protein